MLTLDFQADRFVGKCMLKATTYYISRFFGFYVSDNFIVLLLTGQCVSLFSFFAAYFRKKNQKNYQCKQFASQVFRTLYDKTMKMLIQRNRET